MNKKLGKTLILLLFVIISVSLLIGAVSATDIYVNGTGSDDTGAGTIDNPYKTISFGIAHASTTSTDTVILAPETFNTNTDPTHTDYGITISKNVNIKGVGQDQTIIDAGGHDRIFTINSGCTVTISDLTLKNGNTAGNGGAINNQGTLNLNNCAFIGNTATNGGAINNQYSVIAFIGSSASATNTMTGCTFTGNTATANGGAINNQNSIGAFVGSSASATNTMTGCTFTGNTATTNGGAINNQNSIITYVGSIASATNTMTGCTFTGNTATTNGGAINNDGSNCEIHFSRIVGNTATTGSSIYSPIGLVNAEYNWWGSNTDPKTVINLIFGNVDADPWLKLSITANPTEIFNTMTSQVTADLYADSNGIIHNSEFAKYPSGIPVTFATTWGSIGQSKLKYGTATATFTANGGPISSPIITTASVADIANPLATVTAPITIKPLPITVNAAKTGRNTGTTGNTDPTTTPAPTTNNTTPNSYGTTPEGTQGNGLSGLLSYWWVILIILLLIGGGLLWFLLAARK
ncbi:MAG: hypothetical protein HZC47_10735 [Methanobacterium sp.]|uniref:hypothetical protein n=1 Tax=Methanobacterium sp. TaxID=2164 RepID=UPI003D662725|nr:hypothetical protein [Methanobacterium sp.]